jgi:hypothetical protein
MDGVGAARAARRAASWMLGVALVESAISFTHV